MSTEHAGKQTKANTHTYAHRRRNRYLISSCVNENGLDWRHAIRESNSVENKPTAVANQNDATIMDGNILATSMSMQGATNKMPTTIAKRPPRLLRVSKEFPAAQRARSIVAMAEDRDLQEDNSGLPYPRPEADQTDKLNRRGRHYSQLPNAVRR